MEAASYFMAGPGLDGPRPRSLSIDLPASGGRPRRSKRSQIEAFCRRLQERGDVELSPQLLESVCAHFEVLPTRYALDVNIDGLDVLSHKRLLEAARTDPSTVSFAVRPVEVLHSHHDAADGNAGAEALSEALESNATLTSL